MQNSAIFSTTKRNIKIFFSVFVYDLFDFFNSIKQCEFFFRHCVCLLCLCTLSNKSNVVSNTEITNTNHHGIQKNKSVTANKVARYAINKIMIIYILTPFYKFLPLLYRFESWNIQSFLQLLYKNLFYKQWIKQVILFQKDK